MAMAAALFQCLGVAHDCCGSDGECVSRYIGEMFWNHRPAAQIYDWLICLSLGVVTAIMSLPLMTVCTTLVCSA